MKMSMQKFVVLGSAMLLGVLAGATWAHEGVMAHQHGAAQDHFAHAFSAGLQHTLTGADHVILALGLGVLLCLLKTWLKPFTVIMALLALVVGFVVGTFNVVASPVAEMGIGVSFVLMLLAFWKQKASWILLLMAGVACHGLAHGIVVSDFASLTQVGFLWGMLLSFAVLMVLAYMSAQYVFALHRKNAQHDAF